MHSIKSKIILLILSAMVTMALPLTLMNFRNIEKMETSSAKETLNAKCRLKKNEVDQLLVRCEDFVNGSASALKSTMTKNDCHNADKRQWELSLLKKMMAENISQIPAVASYYVHYNEDLVHGKEGFWYVKSQNRYIPKAITSATDYKANQTKWNAWYYAPLKAKKGTWVKPYYNANATMNLISYGMPVYIEGEFCAIIGIDLSFETLAHYFNHISVYQSGKALLTDHQFNTLSESVTISSVTEIKGIDLQKLKKTSTKNDVIDCQFHAKKSVMAYTTLKNGLRVVMLVPQKEIFAKRDQALLDTAFIAGSLWLLFIIIGFIYAYRITRPLHRLTQAAQSICEGDYHTQLDVKGDDEIAQLTKALNRATESVFKNVSYVSNQAYRDELTKVKNYNAYKRKIETLNDAIDLHFANFAIVMCDMNRLKQINDQYGHEKGSLAIKLMSKVICDIFKHSPVYRIGGDEFVVILENDDLAHMHELLTQLDPYLVDRDFSLESPWLQVAFSMGASHYISGVDNHYKDVFQRADAKMYACKKALHAERK